MRHWVMWRIAVALSFCFPLCLTTHAAECAQPPYDCAVSYIQHGNPRAAIQALTAELQKSPQDLKALNLLGIALTESGQLKNANSRFREVLTVDPNFYPARKNLAINKFSEKQWTEAEAQFKQVLQAEPDDPIVHVYLGEISFERKDCRNALKHYEQGRSHIAQKSVWLVHDAQCELMLNDPSSAAAVLKLLPPNDAEHRFQAGLLLGRAGNYPAAADLFGSARKGYSDPYVAGYNQLLMLTRAASYPQAIQVFNELVAQGITRAEVYNLVSESYVKTGRLARGLRRAAHRYTPGACDGGQLRRSCDALPAI